MKRNLFSTLCLLLLIHTANAQYTSIINSNRPGKTESPYVVGNDVLQFENTSYYKTISLGSINRNTFNNVLNARYGFWNEKLELSVIHHYVSQYKTNRHKQTTGSERFAIGAKYLVFNGKRKETEAMYKNWKKRYGFWHNVIIPAVAVSAYINTPLTNKNFTNGEQTSFSFSIITQNNINKKLRINNQLEYNYFLGNNPEAVYTASVSYAFKNRFNPFIELAARRHIGYSYFNFGFGTPYLVSPNFSVSSYLDTSFGHLVFGLEVGINASYRFDWHKDVWIYKKKELDEALQKKKKEFEENIMSKPSNKKGSFFGNLFKRKEKTKEEKKKEKETTLNNIFNFPTEKAKKKEKVEEEPESLVDPKKTKKKKKKKKKEKEKKNNSFIEGY